MQEVTLENELNRIVYDKVKRDPYPEPIPYIDGDAVRKELKDLKADKIPRPGSKIEYLNRVRQLEAQLISISEDNAIIAQENAEGRKAVDDKYTADIEAAKLDEVNIGQALCNCINHQLNATEWYVCKDSGLLESQQVKADAWRLAQMNIVFEEPTIEAAVSKYEALLTTKPKYNLTWEKSTE